MHTQSKWFILYLTTLNFLHSTIISYIPCISVQKQVHHLQPIRRKNRKLTHSKIKRLKWNSERWENARACYIVHLLKQSDMHVVLYVGLIGRNCSMGVITITLKTNEIKYKVTTIPVIIFGTKGKFPRIFKTTNDLEVL